MSNTEGEGEAKTVIGPKDWDQYYTSWTKIGFKIYEVVSPGQALPDEDIEKLRDDGIEFKRVIGSGAFGEVWEAVLTKFKLNEQNNYVPVVMACKLTSLKTFKDFRTVRGAVFEILRETLVLKKVSHPHVIHFEHVVRIYDEESHFPKPIHVLCFMELCDGNLKGLIQWAGKLSETISNEWFVQIANALKYLHHSGIAHLDLKPDNILYKKNPLNSDQILVKLTDFGLSQIFFLDGPPISETPVGSTNYMAPELLASLKPVYNAYKADVYSLAVTLVESMAGLGSVKLRIIGHIQKRTPFKAISQEVQNLLRGMTAIDPRSRFYIDQVVSHPWTQKIPYIPERYFSLV
jgi:serine/threonine protein kinase